MVTANGSKPKGAINAMIDRVVLANDVEPTCKLMPGYLRYTYFYE